MYHRSISATFSILSGAVLVVGQVVVALGDADLVERAVAAVVGQQQGRDARRVGLERQDQHVEHELDVFRVVGRDARRASRRPGRGRRRTARPSRCASRSRGRRSGTGRASAVCGAEPPLHGAGVVEDEVEDRPLLAAGGAAGSPAARRAAGAEEPLEDEARVGLGRHRRRRRAPGEVVLVGAGVAGVAGAGLPHRRRRSARARGTA